MSPVGENHHPLLKILQEKPYDYNKKEWNSDPSYNMDEPSRHHAKWKTLITEDQALKDSIYMKGSE